MLIYGLIFFCLLFMVNVYVVWIFIEILFLFFFLVVLLWESKDIGLIIYFFFQSLVFLFLFLSFFFFLKKILILLLLAKLGLFPFFYWMVVVRIKVGLIANVFILGLQKVSVFWMFWLVLDLNLRFLFFLLYLRIFFVIINLILVVDLWLLLVYSSIANTGIIVFASLGSNYICLVFLYLSVIIAMILILKNSTSYSELVFILFFFLVVPPFVLFWIKFYIILSLDSVMKLGFFFLIFDVLILLYYFSLIFVKFILLDLGFLIYMINFIVLAGLIFLSN